MLWYTYKKENTQNNVIEGDIRIEMTVETDQKYQEKVEAVAKILCRPKQRYHLNKGNDKVDIPCMEEFLMCLATLC